jgi:glycosyltransferase involved in cell wall biosynthesis
MPYFSVVTPSWNQGPHIEACIRCVLDQKDADFEHLIIDNCSSDETPRILEKFPHLRLVVEKDRGQSDAINKGFCAASGEIICWLNSDDAYPERLFTRLRELFRDPAVDVVFGDVLQIAYDGTGDQVSPARFERREDLIRWWSSDTRLHQPAIFFRRRVVEETGLLREDLHYVMDYEYWWRMSERHRFHYVPEVLAIQHRQLDSKTVQNWNGVYREREKVFSPHYAQLGLSPVEVERTKRRAMAERYLTEAYTVPGNDPAAIRQAFWRSVQQSPTFALHPRSLGLLRRLLSGGRR